MYSLGMFSKESFWLRFTKYAISSVSLILAFAFLLYFSLNKLIETPPTWMDEGIIIETARNIASHGSPSIRISPTELVSGGYVTTSYPVTYPISILFKKYGVNIYSARIVMVIYLLLFAISSLLLTIKVGEKSKYSYILSLLLIVSFAPLYGHGKNVLGEVPGMFYLFISIILISFLSDILNRTDIRIRYKILLNILTGVFIGLTVVTKPIFILLIPSIVLGLIVYLFARHKYSKMFEVRYLALKNSLYLYLVSGLLSVFLPIYIWFKHQFNGESLSFILSVYANPHKNAIFESIISNSLRFFTEYQPSYMLILFSVFSLAIIVKFKKYKELNLANIILWFFSGLILLAYVRTPGYYRYFFEAQIVCLTLLPGNIIFLFNQINPKLKKFGILVVLLLLAIHIRQLFYGSWINQYKDSKRSEILIKELSDTPSSSEVFIYQAPEVATFIPNENYSQYIEITKDIIQGTSSLQRLEKGIPDIVVTKDDQVILDKVKLLTKNKYKNVYTLDRYTFLRKK